MPFTKIMAIIPWLSLQQKNRELKYWLRGRDKYSFPIEEKREPVLYQIARSLKFKTKRYYDLFVPYHTTDSNKVKQPTPQQLPDIAFVELYKLVGQKLSEALVLQYGFGRL